VPHIRQHLNQWKCQWWNQNMGCYPWKSSKDSSKFFWMGFQYHHIRKTAHCKYCQFKSKINYWHMEEGELRELLLALKKHLLLTKEILCLCYVWKQSPRQIYFPNERKQYLENSLRLIIEHFLYDIKFRWKHQNLGSFVRATFDCLEIEKSLWVLSIWRACNISYRKQNSSSNFWQQGWFYSSCLDS